MAGDDGGHAGFLASEAARLGVDDRVTIIARHVSGADKEALFAAARLFAMTSLSENFGIAAFEAMRRGLPVLATPDVGMSEIVRDTQAGLVVDPTPVAISAGLRTMFADPELCRRRGEAGQKHVIDYYGWPAVARRMADLYRSIAEATSPRSAA